MSKKEAKKYMIKNQNLIPQSRIKNNTHFKYCDKVNFLFK